MSTKKKIETSEQDYELAAAQSYTLVHPNFSSVVNDVSVEDLTNYLRNPVRFHKQIRQLSRYYYVKNGIVSQVYDIYKNLPTLNYTVMYNNRDFKKFPTYEKSVNTFLDNINVKELSRDIIFQLVSEGTCVLYKRSDSYIQILDLDYLRFNKQINGEFQPQFDLMYLNLYNPLNNPTYTNYDLYAWIEDLPDEITVAKYNEYRKDSTKRFIPLNMDNVVVLKIKSQRNQALGLPLCIPAIQHILHLELLERSESAQAQRVIQQIIVQSVDSAGKDGKPPSKEKIGFYHANLNQLLQKTDGTSDSGTAALTLPAWVKINPLEVNIVNFTKDVYERVINQILLAMGVSSSVISGNGQSSNFSSSSINLEKIMKDIFAMLDQIENGLNKYLNQIVSTKNVTPKIKFTRDTIMDKKTSAEMAKNLYLQGRGSLKSWVIACGYDFDAYINQVQYENKVLDLDNLEKFPVHPTSFTLRDTAQGQDGLNKDGNPNSGGAPTNDNTNQSDGNAKATANDSNNTPSPSDNK